VATETWYLATVRPPSVREFRRFFPGKAWITWSYFTCRASEFTNSFQTAISEYNSLATSFERVLLKSVQLYSLLAG